MNKLDIGAAVGVVGLGILQVHSSYREYAGPLADIRDSASVDGAARQRLIDADVLTGVTALVVGVSATVASGSPYPLILSLIGYAVIALYYHLALNNPSLGGTQNGDTSG